MKSKDFQIGLLFAIVIPLAFIFSTIACIVSFVRASIVAGIAMLVISAVTMPFAAVGIVASISVAIDERRKKNSHSNGGEGK